MISMHSIETPRDIVGLIRQMIPTGTEHYILSKNGATFINVRTGDHGLVHRLMEQARPSGQV